MRTIIVALESGLELVYELAWTPVADVVWDQLLHLTYTTGLSIDHQWQDHHSDSVTGVCLARTHEFSSLPIPQSQISYWCYQPRPGDICLDPLTEGRDLVSQWWYRDTTVIRQQGLRYPREITANLIFYWRVRQYRSNSGLRRDIWRWLEQNQLLDQIDWQDPWLHAHGRAVVAYLRDHSQLSEIGGMAAVESIRLAV